MARDIVVKSSKGAVAGVANLKDSPAQENQKLRSIIKRSNSENSGGSLLVADGRAINSRSLSEAAIERGWFRLAKQISLREDGGLHESRRQARNTLGVSAAESKVLRAFKVRQKVSYYLTQHERSITSSLNSWVMRKLARGPFKRLSAIDKQIIGEAFVNNV